jgi:murein DD-endopeptidase MepM/ murein hydrolase activator NlpD
MRSCQVFLLRGFCLVFAAIFASAEEATLPIAPTPNDGLSRNADIKTFIQPTSSGRIESGTFGYIRNGGKRLHKGIDIKPVRRNKRGEPMDEVGAILPGMVAYVNRNAGASDFGNYVVLTHTAGGLTCYSLYAHLASIDKNLSSGRTIAAGTRLGVMGRTGNAKIPACRAHLHLEFGMQIGSEISFSNWFAAQHYKEHNRHGAWNGLNLVGINPIELYCSHLPIDAFIRSLTRAFGVEFEGKVLPQFFNKNPGLMDGSDDTKPPIGYRVRFHWTGLPLCCERLYANVPAKNHIRIVDVCRSEFMIHGAPDILQFGSDGIVSTGARLDKIIRLMTDQQSYNQLPNQKHPKKTNKKARAPKKRATSARRGKQHRLNEGCAPRKSSHTARS